MLQAHYTSCKAALFSNIICLGCWYQVLANTSNLIVQQKILVYLFSAFIFFQVDEKQKTVLLTEQGYEDTEEILNVKDLYDPREQWALYILNAIKAKELFLRDVNYIIRGKEVLIVDEFTGRVMQVSIFTSHDIIINQRLC